MITMIIDIIAGSEFVNNHIIVISGNATISYCCLHIIMSRLKDLIEDHISLLTHLTSIY